MFLITNYYTMHKNFQHIQNFINEMKDTSSTNLKKEILRKYDTPFLRKLLEYVYSPFKQYGVRPANLKKNESLCVDVYDDLFCMLDDLNERRITGHHAVEVVNGFIKKYNEFTDVILQVLDRNLKTRATTSIINDVMPNTIPTFEVALAKNYRDYKKSIDIESGAWFASRKLDGVRCICIISDSGSIRFFSRNGKEFFTLDKLASDLKALNLRSVVLDGELCTVQQNGIEDFQEILKQIDKKDYTIENPKYYVFDFINLAEFESRSGQTTFLARQIMLNGWFHGRSLRFAEVLPQIQLESVNHLDKLVDEASQFGFEGVMIRKNVGYEGKRTKNLLKLKKMMDSEYVVVDYEIGTNRVLENGKEIEEPMLAAVLIKHKENTVRVGSGFSLDQRREFFKHPEKIVGKTICVQYFEETTDQNGNYSLRFPVIKAIYENPRNF